MADCGLPNGGPPHTRPPDSVDDLSKHAVTLKQHLNLDLLLPYLEEKSMLTRNEYHELSHSATPVETRTMKLVIDILPTKGRKAVEAFKQALLASLREKGSSGHWVILQEVFGHVASTDSSSAIDKEWLPTADIISEESEDFSLFLLKFSGVLQNGSKVVVGERLRKIATYFCHLKVKSGMSLLQENVKSELCSEDLTFSKLFICLDSKSDPPVISDRDVSMLHKFIKVLGDDKRIVDHLSHLLTDYEQNSGITPVSKEPPLSPESASLKVKVPNAHSGNSKLKNGVKRFFFESLKFKFRGSGIGSVIFYWEFPKEYYQQLLESFKNVYDSKFSLQQFRVTKVEARQPYQIYLEMEITDPDLLQLSQQQHFVANDIAPEQEKFIMLLIKIEQLVGAHAKKFLSESRTVIPRIYSRFEGKSFLTMIDQLISESSLHCYDISYIQLFLCSLLKWDTTEGNKCKEQLVALLREVQDYEPIPTGFPLPCKNIWSRTRSVQIISCFIGIVSCISYEIMMTLKYVISRYLNLPLSAFHYSGWSAIENGFRILWNTFNFDRIEDSCNKIDMTGGLEMIGEPVINYPHSIKFFCKITDTKLFSGGSPLLVPDLKGMFEMCIIVHCMVHVHLHHRCDPAS